MVNDFIRKYLSTRPELANTATHYSESTELFYRVISGIVYRWSNAHQKWVENNVNFLPAKTLPILAF